MVQHIPQNNSHSLGSTSISGSQLGKYIGTRPRLPGSYIGGYSTYLRTSITVQRYLVTSATVREVLQYEGHGLTQSVRTKVWGLWSCTLKSPHMSVMNYYGMNTRIVTFLNPRMARRLLRSKVAPNDKGGFECVLSGSFSWWRGGSAAVLVGLPETDSHSGVRGGLVRQEPPPVG